jgi:hypothetical protein
MAVDRLVSAEGAHGVQALAGGGADHVGAAPARELRREVADTASRAVDEHPLPVLELSVIEQALPGGERGEGNRPTLHVVERGRLGRETAGRHGGVHRGDAVSVEAGQRVHRFADRDRLEAVGDSGNDPGELVGRGSGKAIDGPVELVAGNGGGVDLYECCPGMQARSLDLPEYKATGTRSTEPNRSHRPRDSAVVYPM